MSPKFFIGYLTLIVLAIWGIICIPPFKRSHDKFDWDSGSIALDSLLIQSDTYIDSATALRDSIDDLFEHVVNISKTIDTPAAHVINKWMMGKYLLLNDELPIARNLFKQAAGEVDTTNSPYLAARVKLDYLTNLPTTGDSLNGALYSVLEKFAVASDSLRMYRTITEIAHLNKDRFDNKTRIGFLQAAYKIIPSSRNDLKTSAVLKLLLAQREVINTHKADQNELAEYKTFIKSLTRNKALFKKQPILGTLAYSDLYRFSDYKDNDAYYKARHYASNTDLADTTGLGKESVAIFLASQLQRDILSQKADSAHLTVSALTPLVDANGGDNKDVIDALIDYYKTIGNESQAEALQKMNGAYATAIEAKLTQNSAQSREALTSLRNILEQHHEIATDNGTLKWIIIGVIALLGLCGAHIYYNQYTKDRMKLHSGSEKPNLAAGILLPDYEVSATANGGRADRKSKPLSQHELSEIRDCIKNMMGNNRTWESFESAFNQLRPNFKNALLADYPTLTPGELRMACLMSLDMETRQISSMLRILPESVKKTRHRLRSKLDVDPETNIPELLSKYC